MLKIFLNNILNGINKSLGFAQTLTKKSFQFILDDRDIVVVF